MRIAFLTHQWPGARMGGIGSAVAQSAAALARAGHDVHVFTLTLPDDVRADIPSRVTIHETPDLASRVHQRTVSPELSAAAQSGGDGVYRLSIASLLCQELKNIHTVQPFDIVESPEVEALALPLLLDPHFDAPIVTHLHCCTALAIKFNNAADYCLSPSPGNPSFPSTGTPGEGREGVSANDPFSAPNERADTEVRPCDRTDYALLPALEFAAVHLSDALCAPTQAVVQATRTCCRIDAPVEIIPHAIATPSPFTPPPDDGPILFVGRLERLKGVEAIADALNLFLPNHPAATFRFMGPDTSTAPGHTSMRQWLESRLAPAIRPRVHFTGQLPASAIADEWQHARFGVMPSLWENFSMSLCEAMSQGRTVIVAQGTGSIELLADAGPNVPQNSPAHLAAAMDHLWTNPTTLHRLSRAAHERITAFSPATISDQRLTFYQRVVHSYRLSLRKRVGVRGNDESISSTISRQAKLLSLPPQCAAALLPALLHLTQSLSGLQPTSQTPGSRLLHVMKQLETTTGSPAQILLYGAGKHTARLLTERHRWESQHHKVVGIIDDHPRFAQSPVYLDLPVQSLESAAARVLSGSILLPIVLSTDTYEDQFWTQSAPLRKAGVPVYRLYS
jgi:glycosyltransferase involved in cell wall biosynthesis